MAWSKIAGYVWASSAAILLAFGCEFTVVNDFPTGSGWGVNSGLGGAAGQGGTDTTTTTTTSTTTTTASEKTCWSCHGTKDSKGAPPPAAGGESDPTNHKVGAHATHLNTASAWHAPVPCQSCHYVPTSTDCPNQAEYHCTGTVQLFFSLGATAHGAQPVYDYEWLGGTYTCTGIYCHGATLEAQDAGVVANTVPTWNSSPDAGTDQEGCGTACHTNPPGAPHDASGDPCETCHSAVIQTYNAASPGNSVWADPSKHIDGITECTTCGN